MKGPARRKPIQSDPADESKSSRSATYAELEVRLEAARERGRRACDSIERPGCTRPRWAPKSGQYE